MYWHVFIADVWTLWIFNNYAIRQNDVVKSQEPKKN